MSFDWATGFEFVGGRRGSASFTPAQLSGLQRWYTFTPAYCYSDVGATVPCVDGADIRVAKDRSGNLAHATAAAGVVKLRLIGGVWRAVWQGLSNSSLHVPTIASGPGLAAHYLAERFIGGDGNPTAHYTSGASDDTCFVPYVSGNIYHAFGTSVRKDNLVPGVSLTVFRTLEALGTASGHDMWLDGSNKSTAASNTLPAFANPIWYGGDEGFTGSTYQSAELIICSAAPSAPTRASLRTYLATRAP